MAWTTRSIFMEREPLTSTLPTSGSRASTAAFRVSMSSKWRPPPTVAASPRWKAAMLCSEALPSV